jgi:hypothetical protein
LVSQGGFFRCGGLSELENKGVLLRGIGRGKELFLGWGWVVGEKGGYSIFSFPIIWLLNKDIFPRKYF